MVDVITLCEPMGKALVTEPVVASLILGGRLVELLGVGEQRKEILSSLVSDQCDDSDARDCHQPTAQPIKPSSKARTSLGSPR